MFRWLQVCCINILHFHSLICFLECIQNCPSSWVRPWEQVTHRLIRSTAFCGRWGRGVLCTGVKVSQWPLMFSCFLCFLTVRWWVFKVVSFDFEGIQIKMNFINVQIIIFLYDWHFVKHRDTHQLFWNYKKQRLITLLFKEKEMNQCRLKWQLLESHGTWAWP